MKKVIFFFAWIGIFLLSVTGMAYIAVPKYFVTVDTTTLIFKVVAFNICLLYLFICILKLSSNFSKTEDYVIKTEHGSVHISPDTVKNLIRELLSKDKDIKGLRIDCGNKGRKFFVKISLEILSNSSIANKTLDIQSFIKNSLEEKLDLKVDEIEVKISKLSMKKDPMV